MDLDAKRFAPVDGLASSPPPPSSPQIGQSGLNVTSAGSLVVSSSFEKTFDKLTNDNRSGLT